MLSCCKEAVANVPGRDWCVLIQKELHQEMMERLHPMGCDLLGCHIVLHLFEPKKQVSLLRLLAQCIADNGLLLLSGYSEPSDQNATQLIVEVGLQRLPDQNRKEDQVEAILSSRNKVVCSINQQSMSTVLTSEDLTPALQLYQGLFSRLWVSRRQGGEISDYEYSSIEEKR